MSHELEQHVKSIKDAAWGGVFLLFAIYVQGWIV